MRLTNIAALTCCAALMGGSATAQAHSANSSVKSVSANPSSARIVEGRAVADTVICHPIYSVTGREGWVCYYVP